MVPLSVNEVGEELLSLQEKKSIHIRYQEVIAETGAALETLEQHWRGTRFADRVRMVRLVKSETAKTMQAYASLLGYSERQLLRWWACYKTGGLDALIEQHLRSGRPSRMTQQAWEQIDAAMQEGQIDTLEATRQFLQSTCHITSKSINAISWLFKRRKTKWKTGGDGIGRLIQSNKMLLKPLVQW